MEVEVDLASIRDEELLRRMWQQSEDFGHKKDIRQHLYKLREARLREFYTIGTDIMDCPPGQGIIKKSPLTPSHGDSLADQSFQSFKSKEIRDSESPTKDMKFAQQQLHSIRDGSICVKPDTSGWNVVTSSELNPDGTGYKTETLATTGGIRKIAGGQAEFAGKNEHMQKASEYGDDKNFVKSAAESSNTHLQESSVVGDEQSGRIEKKSSTTVSSSSKSFVSKSTTGDDGGYVDQYSDYPSNAIQNRRDSTQSNLSVNSNMSTQQQQRQLTLQEKLQQTRKNVESRSTTSVREEEHHREQRDRQHQQTREDVEQQQYSRKQQQDDRIIREQQQQQQQQQKTDQKSVVSKEAQRYMTQHTDRDGITYTKSPVINQDSPAELQREFQRLETQPGKIISRTIEYPKPNLKMIVEKKELADGTIITSRNYETEGTPTVIEPQQKVVSGSRKVEEGGSYKISITKGSTDDDQHQFTKNVDQRSRQILRDTDRKLTNTNERNITNRTVTSDERENYDREVQQKRTNVNEDILNQDRINQTRQITRDHQENINKINRIDIRENQERYEREFQDWQNNVSGDTVDKSIVSNIQQTARDHVENLKNQVETFETHKTVKKDLSQTMRKENISSQDYIQTENGCIMVDRNNRGRPEKMMSTPTNQFEDCNQYNETRTTKNETYNKYVDETGNDYHPTGQRPRQQKPEQDFTTHGFPSQRPDTDSKDTYISTEQYQNRTERINKNEDFSTHGFPSVRDPTPKKPFDHSPTQSTGRQPTPDNLTQGRTPKNEKPDYTTHGFPSARVPDEKKVVDHGPVRSPHDKKTDQSFSTHGFPSVRDPTPKTPFDHGPVKSPSSKHPKPDYSTHGVPSVGTPTERKPAGHDYPGTKSPHNERPSQDYTTKNGFPAAREPTPSKRTEEVNIVEVKKSNQYQTRSQQKTTEKKTEMYKSTESLRREKKTDAAHDAFARSLRCASPVDMPRRDSNASQKSTSYRTHSIQTSRGSTPTYRAPTATSKLKTRDVHHSNETIDLGSSPHHADDLKRRGTSKITTTTTSTTTRDNSGEIQKKNISKLNRQNKAVAYEPTITKKTIIEDDRFVGADEIIEEPIVKKNYKQLCPDSCPLPKRFDEITEITKNVSPENYGAKRSVKSPSQNYMEPTESQISRVSKNFEENLKVNAKTHEPEYELKKVVFSNRETNKPEEENLPRNKSPIRDSSTPERSHPKRHYLEPTESQISRVNKNIENYVEGNETVSSHRASSPIRKSSPIRETSPNRKTSPIRTHTISNKSVEKTQSSEEHNNQHQNYSKPYTIVGPVPIKPVGYVSKKVSSEITTDFKEIDDNKVTYPGFLKKSKSKSPKDSPAVSPDRTNSRKTSPQPNDKTPFTTKNRSNDSPISNRKPSGPIQQKEPYHVPQYDSPKSKPTSLHPQSISPERTTTTRDLLPSSRTTTKTNKFQSTDTREDITNDYENITKPTYPREPHYDSPVSKPSTRYPSSTSPERNTIRDDLTTKTTKTNKVDKTVIREDITNDYEDSSKPSRPREPHYASPISKPSSRHPSSTSPERNTIIRDDLTTKTTKTNKVDRTVIRADITNDYEDSSEPSRPREPHYASPISKPSSRHPSSTSPERNTIRDDLTTKTTKTNKVDRTVIREDITNDYEDSSEPSRPREPHYASPVSKPSSRYPSSTSPERNNIRDDLTTKTTKTNKVDRTVIREDITNDYEDCSEPSRPREPHYASPISKPSSRYPSSTSPERNNITDDLTTKTTKTNKVDRTVIREDITNDYEDSSEPSRPREPHYASPISTSSSRHPSSTSPERNTIIRDDLTTKTTKTNKVDRTVIREDITNDYEDSSEPSRPREPHYASPISKPSSRHPSSTSPERNTIIRDDLTTKTTKTNKVIREDITNDYEDSSEPSRPREQHYASPISKPSSRHPSSTSPERNTIIRDDLTSKTTKTNKVDRTVIREDITNDYEDSSEPSRPREPHYTSPTSTPSSKHPSSTSPERNTIRDDLTTKTTKTNKVDRTVIREDITNDYVDISEPSRPREPHYASPISKPSSRHPSSTSPERNTIIRDDLTTKTTKTNKVDKTVIREDITTDYEDSSEPSRPREPHYASPISKPSSRHPSSTSPERNTIIRDDLTTKTTKTNKVDRTVIREDITNDYQDSSEPSRPREPHYTSPISKPSSRHPSSTSPERNTIIRDDLTTKTIKTNKVDRTVIREDITNDYEDSSEPSRPHEPHYASPISKPSSKHPSSTSPERNTIIRDDLITKTTKTNKVDRTVIREDITNDYEDSSEPTHHRQPHYASPISKPSSRYPSSTSPERTTTIRDDLTTTTIKTNKLDSTVTRDDTTHKYEDSLGPSCPRKPHHATPKSKPTSGYPQSTSPERTTILRDDSTKKTSRTNKYESILTQEDNTDDFEETTDLQKPRQPHKNTPSAKYPKSISPDRTTITRDDLSTETNKFESTVTREHNLYGHDDNSRPHYPLDGKLQPNIPKSKGIPKSSSPERKTSSKNDSTTEFTKIKTNSILRDTTKKPSKTSDDEGMEPESPRSNSPTSDFEYRRNTEIKSKVFTTDLDSENIYIRRDSNKIRDEAFNTEFITKERENVYRETSPVHDKYRPRSTTQEYFEQTEKIENMHYPSSKSPEDNKPKEPFFLRENSPYEEEGSRKPDESPKPKTKAPFNRRETFDERCRQVLGINETNEINESTSVTMKHKNTSQFIDNEKNVEDIRKLRKSSTPSPVPSPRSASPKKIIPKQDHVSKTINTYDKFIKHEKELFTEKDTETTRSGSPGRSPTRKISPQRSKPTATIKDVSYLTNTKTTRQQGYSPKDTPTGSPYTRSPASSPVRRPKSPDHISKLNASTVPRDQSPETQTHITIAKIKISPSTPKSYVPETNLMKPQKPKSSPVITTTTSTTTGNRNTTKSTKSSPDNNRPNYITQSKKNVPLIHKKSDSELDKESDIVSDDEDVITTTTTKITKTTTKKNTPNKKLPVTERKESAPVYRSTQIDRDQKMTRSTSDNILKTQKRTKLFESDKLQNNVSVGPKSPRKTSLENKKDLKTERRPSKCLTTKTINLSTKTNIINSEDMENVIIDIQQAKSSREPSPNKMVPIPVPLNEDTGKPRYPDKVQEPEEHHRRTKIKNVPIYEEAKDDFVGCHISEVRETDEEFLRSKHLSRKLFNDEKTTIKSSIEIDSNTNYDEDCLLSVHDKVSKFINTAEEVTKPKSSVPFQRDVPQMNFSEDDDCLLSVNDKVNKFLTTAEKVTKDIITSTGKRIETVNLDEIDKNLREDECILSVSQKVNKFINTAEKLVETQPQKSPELVAKIEKQISRQSDDDRNEEECINTKTTKVKSRITERYTPDKPKREPLKTSTKPVIKTTDAVRKAKSVFEKNELKDVKLSKTTATTKQRDIISRPSVWETKKQETIENRKNIKNRDDTDYIKTNTTTKPVSLIRNLDIYPSDSFGNTVITSKTELSAKAEDVTARLTRKTTPRRPSDTPTSRYPGKKTPTVGTKTEYIDEYTNKFGKSRPKDYSPNTSPDRGTSSRKHPVESKTEYTDEYTDKYGYTEKNISKKNSSSSITSKRIDQRYPEQSPTRISRKPTESLKSPSDNKPETYSPSWSRNKQPKQSSPTRTDSNSPTRLTSSYVEENTYSSYTTNRDNSPTRPSSTHYNKRPDDHSPARSINHYTEEQKSYRTSTRQNGTPSPSISDRKYLFENIDPSAPRPSYMDHTKASLEHIRRDSLEVNRTSYNRRLSVDEESFDGNPRSAVKFGVDLKHHDESKPRRKSSSPEIPHIEEIFELDLLEQMLSVVVGYEQRRRIRSQIRIVKKMIEQKAKEEAQIAYIRETSPARRSGSSERENSISSITRKNIRNKTEDEQVAYIRETSPARRSSPTRSVTSSSSQKKNIRTKSNSSFIENESKHIEKHEKIRERSPQSKTKTVTTIRETRKVDEKPKNKTKPVPLKDSKSDEKPIWATKNILKKPSENNYSPKTSTTKKIHTSTTKTTQSQRQKISSDEDCITSSYGIGPTDEDGRPLFGIRALKKKQQPSETSKVTGTMITENYYSENGSAPLGERTVTVYSSNPNDIDEYESKFDNTKRSGSIKRESSKQNGLTSVTRTQKFGDDYPIHDTEYHALRDDSTSTNSKSSKVNRKSSVKEMSEKFIRKESSSSVTEKKTSSSSTSYPKAGLILHTKTTNRQSNPTEHDNTDDYDYEYDNSTRQSQLINESESDSESCKITRTINKSSKSFLNTTGSKVTGVDDVLERMRNADNVIEDGDTVEDHEARALLNKFLGATVLMSGVESMVPKAVVTTRTIKVEGSGPRSTQEVKTTRVTKNIKTEGSSSSPVAQQTCDIEEIWDIEFLKELLEQSTSYEERSTIRARIKQLMAEREVCAGIVASVNAELQSPNAKKQSSKVETTTKKIVTTTTTTSEKEEEEEEVSDDGEEGEEEEEEEEVEVDDDSSSEYEEIIVEVTDSEDDEIEFKESLNVVKNTQPNPNDKKIIGKTIIQSQTNVTTEQQVKKQLPCDSKQIKVTTNKTDNSNKDNIEGKIIKNIDEDLSESSDSLLLPLLQGLLHKNMPTITHNQTTKTTNPKITNNTNNSSSSSSNNNRKNNNVNSNNNDDSNKQVNNTKKTIQIMNTQSQQKNQTNTNKSIASLTNNNKKNNTGHHHIEDSGTESGEDLRLIAAGLRDTMQMHSIKDPSDTGLISEVTTALNRLEQSLKEGKHIKLENSKRNALLNLVGRLQTGLISPDKIPPPTPAPDQTGEMETSSPEADNHRGGNRQRFAKRRSRANRHTVGVSREELADARRYMEEMVMIENMSNCTTPESSAVTPSDLVPQPVKNEDSSVIKPTVNSVNQQQQQSNSSTLYRPNQFLPNNLKDTTAGGSHEEYIPDKPGVQMRGKKSKYEPNQRLSGNLDQQGPVIVSRRPLSDSYTAALGQQIPNQTYQNVAQPHFNEIVNHQQPQFTDHKKQPTYENNPYTAQQSTNSSQYGSAFNAANPIEQHYDGFYECVSPNNVPLNRFSNKKLAMKRANTIDIPKPMKYLHDMESDSDAEERGVSSTKSIGLRGTVQVSVKTKQRQVLPAFQPKTENDIKFLQFIQKQGSSTGLGWNNPNRTVSNWTNKFGNIKNSFESGATSTTSKPPVPASAAKNFWKKNDSQQNVGGKTLVSKVSNTPKTLSRPPWADQNYSSNVLTSALKTKERNEYPTTFHGHSTSFDQQYSPMQPQQQEYAQLSQHETMQQQHPQIRQQQSPIQRQYMQSPQNHIPQQQIIKPKPISLNNFSHAPQSVFKPVDPVTPEYPERFKPIHTDSRLHQSEPHLNFQSNTQMYHDQIIQQEQTNKPWSLVGKYSAPSSPHHSIPSPTKSWFTTKNSTPSSPVTSTLPWLSKNKVDNRIRTKAEKFDKRSPPPANLHRHNSLRGKDQDYQNRMSSYDLDKVDLKRPSLPNTTEPYVNGVYQSQPFYGSNPKINHGRQEPQYQPTDCQYQQMAPVTKYQQSPVVAQYQQSAPVGQYNPLPPSYNSAENIQQASQKLDNRTQYRQPSTQYKSVPSPTYQTIPYTSTDYSEPAISTFVQSRTREQSLTNPNAEPLVLTSTKPSFGPTVPLKIFDYPSPSCSISSPNFTQNDATDDDLDPESMTEYKTETRVMTGPVSQQAVTVGNKTRHVGNEEKHTSGAKDLLSVMKNLGNATISKDKKSSNVCLSPDGRTYQAPLVEPIFPEVVVSDQNRMPAYIESNPLPYQPQNAQPFSKYHTQTSSSGLAAINGSNPEITRQTQYQQNPTYVPPVQQTQTSAMYTGYPPGYRLPPEANTEFDFKSNQSYQPVPELNDIHNMHQQQIQNYQSVDLRQNQSYEQPRVQNFEPLIESHQLPNHNNQYQYPDVQKNLNQHREVHDNYPKQFDFQTQQHEHQKQEQQYQESIEKSRKKSMPKVDFKDAPRSVYISENPPKQNVQPKVTYQDLKPVKRQDTTTSIKIDPHQAYLKPTEIDPQSPKFYVDAQPTHQIVKKPESKLINKETTHRQLQNSVEESRHQKTVQQSKLYKTEQKSKVIYEQSKKQVKSTNKVEQKQQKQQHIEVSTKVHTQQKVFQENKTNIKTLSETEKISTSRKVVSEASQEIIEKGEYKSSAPTDTPDIVKSSLPKDDNFPILKKFGPPQRHLYTPNAYKSPLGRSDSNTDVKPAGPIMTRKFSDPTIMAKFSAPEIIETPSTPMPADSKDDIPRNIVFNNVAQFSNMSRRISDTTETYQKFPVPNTRPNLLSKSDSWTKICQQQTSAKPPSPKFNQSGEFGGHGLRRAKSGHTLALPKMYEAGIKREEVTEKQKTVAAYFSGNKSPNSLSRNSSQTNLTESISTNDTSISTTKRTSINRIKTSAKASVNKQYPSTGLCRSATMPHILNLLDEKSTRSETTETKNEDGSVVTTTTKVTTRTVSSGSTTVPKQVSPFAKFKQLDKQNSITSQNSPKTPITPSGTNRGAPIFAFTDPTVAARAATAKEQLLHWCQMKTKEYENIQITNFSTSWNDGMAFCALIHHFLPDAFDFTKLTPKQRRYNFTLAFRVADEKAGIAPLLDVEDMVVMKRPDWKCVFTYVQSIHRHFRNCQ